MAETEQGELLVSDMKSVERKVSVSRRVTKPIVSSPPKNTTSILKNPPSPIPGSLNLDDRHDTLEPKQFPQSARSKRGGPKSDSLSLFGPGDVQRNIKQLEVKVEGLHSRVSELSEKLVSEMDDVRKHIKDSTLAILRAMEATPDRSLLT